MLRTYNRYFRLGTLGVGFLILVEIIDTIDFKYGFTRQGMMTNKPHNNLFDVRSSYGLDCE